MCAWLVCIVCSDVKTTGFLDDKRIRKGLVGPQGSIFVTTTIQQGHVFSYMPSEEKPRRDWK